MNNKKVFAEITKFFDGDDVPAKMVKRAFTLSLTATKKEKAALKSGGRDAFAAAVANVSGCKAIESWLKGLPFGLVKKAQKAGEKIAPQTCFVANADVAVESPMAAAFAAAAKK